ncbi:MAG: hypothetical protein HZY78_08915 [Burkholderiaceae bacterium]|nr:MAG: hypothetical protein HZY78_08915 [Burkholderiaceae bacterium]
MPGEHRLAVALNDVERRYLTKEEGLPFKVERGGPRYFRVADTQTGVVTLTAVAEEKFRPSYKAWQPANRTQFLVCRALNALCVVELKLSSTISCQILWTRA